MSRKLALFFKHESELDDGTPIGPISLEGENTVRLIKSAEELQGNAPKWYTRQEAKQEAKRLRRRFEET